MGWKVKAAVSNKCDSCRWFCTIAQRIQVKLRPSRGTEEQEILLVISVCPCGDRAQAEGDTLAGCQDRRMAGEETQHCSLLLLLEIFFSSRRERHQQFVSHFSTSLLRARSHCSILRGNSWCLIKGIFFLLFVLILTQLCHTALPSSL